MAAKKFLVEVAGNWAGSTGGWRPAVCGVMNQTGKDDREASTFTTLAAARAMRDQLRDVADDHERAHCWDRAEFRVRVLDLEGGAER